MANKDEYKKAELVKRLVGQQDIYSNMGRFLAFYDTALNGKKFQQRAYHILRFLAVRNGLIVNQRYCLSLNTRSALADDINRLLKEERVIIEKESAGGQCRRSVVRLPNRVDHV